jgi:hypothetical protein
MPAEGAKGGGGRRRAHLGEGGGCAASREGGKGPRVLGVGRFIYGDWRVGCKWAGGGV